MPHLISRRCSACQQWFSFPYQFRFARKFCSRPCANLGRKHVMTKRVFLNMFDRSAGPESCWLFQGHLNKEQYGRISFQGKRWIAHRLVHALLHPDFDMELRICHTCDNPPCGNPRHLFQGTVKDNAQDALKKGRLSIRYGEDCPAAKLTVCDVLTIRALHGKERCLDLAARYHVNRNTIGRIWRRLSWKHPP